jgi:hypothetical protein
MLGGITGSPVPADVPQCARHQVKGLEICEGPVYYSKHKCVTVVIYCYSIAITNKATEREVRSITMGYTSAQTGPYSTKIELRKKKHSSFHQTTILNT